MSVGKINRAKIDHKLQREKYFHSKTASDFPSEVDILGMPYTKVEDLRYGTNPHPGASFWSQKVQPVCGICGYGNHRKQANPDFQKQTFPDLNHGSNIVKYFDVPACAVMKHLNPSGAAIKYGDMDLKTIYMRARDADAVAAFGSTVVFNTKLDADTAKEIMTSIVEVVAAPDYDKEALDVLEDFDTYRKNKRDPHNQTAKYG